MNYPDITERQVQRAEELVSWTRGERLRFLWYRLRLTVSEMNCATRRLLERQTRVPSRGADHAPAASRSLLVTSSPAPSAARLATTRPARHFHGHGFDARNSCRGLDRRLADRATPEWEVMAWQAELEPAPRSFAIPPARSGNCCLSMGAQPLAHGLPVGAWPGLPRSGGRSLLGLVSAARFLSIRRRSGRRPAAAGRLGQSARRRRADAARCGGTAQQGCERPRG